MIRLLLPPMTHVTSCPIFASCQIVINHVLCLPIYTRYRLIRVNRWIPSIILPIMRINTLILLMFSQVQNTKFCLVIEHIKVFILDIVMNQFGLDLLLTMGICAELLIRTLGDRIRPMCTKAFSIILWMVLFFNWRMGLCTLITRWTLLSFLYVRTYVS